MTPQGKITPEIAQAQLDARCAQTVSYSVEITGHDEPFKWEVKRLGPGATAVTPSGCKGESDTYEGAMLDASESAHKAEWNRLHESTKRTEHLFDCPVKAEFDD